MLKMDIKKISKLIQNAKKNYVEKSDDFNMYLSGRKQFSFPLMQNRPSNSLPKLEQNDVSSDGSVSQQVNALQDDNVYQDFNQASSPNNAFQNQPMYPPSYYPQVNVIGGPTNGAPINIIAKNYIDPFSLEDEEEAVNVKKKKKHELADVPINLIKESSTDWEPINYRGVNDSYALYKMSNVFIKFDEEHQKLLYKIVEPELSAEDQKVLLELKKGFMYVFEKISTKDLENSSTDLINRGIKELSKKYGIKISDESFTKIAYYLERDFLGLEQLEPIMHDKYIEDISCDGLGVPVFVNHLKYGPIEVNRKFDDANKLNSFIVKLAQKSNQEVSLSRPILQGALPDGSRIEAIYGKEVSEKGSSFTIRKFRAEPFTPIHLIEFGTMPPLLLAYLWLAVENKKSILVSGGTATGKTTILNALSLFVPPAAKIVSIEDTPEINLPHEHWLPLISRESQTRSEVSMFDLLKASLRERPDYIIVGEIRGAEAAILFQGMATGHAGLGTVHAEKFTDLVNRMTIKPIELPKQLITELNICIFMNRVKVKDNMVRRAASVVEVVDYDSRKDTFETNDFMTFLPVEDSFDFSEKSFVIKHLLELRGGKEEALWNEIEKRRRILDMMSKNFITEFEDVNDIIQSYYKAPSEIFDYLENFISLKKNKSEE